MDQPTLSDDSNVALLLTSHLGASVDEASDDTLGPTQWHDFSKDVSESSLGSVGELLNVDAHQWPSDIFSGKINRNWVDERLSTAAGLALELEDLNQSGIWVTTEFEETFPSRLSETLDRKAPPFLYVAGQVDNFQNDAIGFVGSRDSNDQDLDYTRELVDMAIQDELSIVSGGAKGVDEASENEGLRHGGPVIEFPAEGIKNCLSNGTIRDSVVDGELTLASMYSPDASWSIGGAMGRNKLIHGFGTYTIVVRSGDESGGTWAGATENLSNDWSTLLVCNHDSATGNEKLISKGGIPIDPRTTSSEEAFNAWVDGEITAVSAETDSKNHDPSGSNNGSNQREDDDEQSSLGDFDS
jgi:predicted Rossmann fold nucleotide-binding protein DprA/Smf involved in DNA uptake